MTNLVSNLYVNKNYREGPSSVFIPSTTRCSLPYRVHSAELYGVDYTE